MPSSSVERARAANRELSTLELGVLALIAVVMAAALLWNAACYGAGWCRWAGPERMTEWGYVVHDKGAAGQTFDFRFGGWDQP